MERVNRRKERDLDKISRHARLIPSTKETTQNKETQDAIHAMLYSTRTMDR